MRRAGRDGDGHLRCDPVHGGRQGRDRRHADREVASMLMRTGKKVVLAVNKIDAQRKLPDDFYDFYELGLGEPIPISAANMLNLGDLSG